MIEAIGLAESRGDWIASRSAEATGRKSLSFRLPSLRLRQLRRPVMWGREARPSSFMYITASFPPNKPDLSSLFLLSFPLILSMVAGIVVARGVVELRSESMCSDLRSSPCFSPLLFATMEMDGKKGEVGSRFLDPFLIYRGWPLCVVFDGDDGVRGRCGGASPAQGLYRQAGGSGGLLRRRRARSMDPGVRVLGVVPRPMCHSDRCSVVRGCPIFGSQSFSAMVLWRLFGSWCSSSLPPTASVAKVGGGVDRWFSLFAPQGPSCIFSFFWGVLCCCVGTGVPDRKSVV